LHGTLAHSGILPRAKATGRVVRGLPTECCLFAEDSMNSYVSIEPGVSAGRTVAAPISSGRQAEWRDLRSGVSATASRTSCSLRVLGGVYKHPAFARTARRRQRLALGYGGLLAGPATSWANPLVLSRSVGSLSRSMRCLVHRGSLTSFLACCRSARPTRILPHYVVPCHGATTRCCVYLPGAGGYVPWPSASR